jgi:hypothetical protein
MPFFFASRAVFFYFYHIHVKKYKLDIVILFILILFWFIEIEIIGRLFIGEILFFIIASFIIISSIRYNKIKFSLFLNKTLLLLSIWLVSQIITDIIQNIPFHDYSRGWARIVFFGTNLIALDILIDKKLNRFLILLASYELGTILKTFFFPEIFFQKGSIWKFGYGIPITILVALFSLSVKFKTEIIFFLLSIINLLLDFRSLALFCLIAAIFSIISYKILSNKERGGNLKFKYIMSGIFICCLLIIFIFTYTLMGKIDLGVNVGQRQLEGSAKNPFYGRLEIFIGLQAIWDSPLIGRGSWAKDDYYVTLLKELNEELERGFYIPDDDEAPIPAHSYLLGSWIEAGIFGALFWIYVLWNGIKAMKVTLKSYNRYSPIIIFLIAEFIWSILFSPFGAAERITSSFNLILIDLVINKNITAIS